MTDWSWAYPWLACAAEYQAKADRLRAGGHSVLADIEQGLADYNELVGLGAVDGAREYERLGLEDD